jgi:hypothetical protein
MGKLSIPPEQVVSISAGAAGIGRAIAGNIRGQTRLALT